MALTPPPVFIAGLPRSGSTVFSNILAQNPAFHVSTTSGLIDLLMVVRQQWDALENFKAAPNDAAKLSTLRGCVSGFYAAHQGKQVFDRCRAWHGLIELLEQMYPDIRILVPVRDMREVLASHEKLWRNNMLRHDDMSNTDRVQCTSVAGRMDYYLRYDQPLGLAYNWITDAMHRGHTDKLHFVHYDKLVSQPEETMAAVYGFIGKPVYQHDFQHIEQTIHENDAFYGKQNLHTIRPELKKPEGDWRTLLGPTADRFSQLNIFPHHG